MYEIWQSGAKLVGEDGKVLSQEYINAQLALLKEQQLMQDKQMLNNRQIGINQAKQKGVYKGRAPIAVDVELLKEIREQFKKGHLSEQEAMNALGVNSRSTFYRKLKQF